MTCANSTPMLNAVGRVAPKESRHPKGSRLFAFTPSHCRPTHKGYRMRRSVTAPMCITSKERDPVRAGERPASAERRHDPAPGRQTCKRFARPAATDGRSCASASFGVMQAYASHARHEGISRSQQRLITSRRYTKAGMTTSATCKQSARNATRQRQQQSRARIGALRSGLTAGL